jgi:hypothetical protein
MIACGGEAICDIYVLPHQSEVFEAVASPATCWRAPAELRGNVLLQGACGRPYPAR